MPSQLIGSSEPPAAAFPAAEVRLLSGVRPQVRLEVARLGVRLVARLVAARVDRHLLPAPTSPASLLQRNDRLWIRQDELVSLVMMMVMVVTAVLQASLLS